MCSSSNSDSCETSPDASEICLTFTPDDKCVTLIDGNGFTVRGCSSQVTCDASDSSSCQICEGNDCNVSNLKRKSDGKPGQWQSLPLTCLTCSGADDCKSGNTQQTCSGDEYCMTVFDSSGEVINRGCSNAVEELQGSYCDINYDHCFNCNSNLCNTASVISDYSECIYCDSKTNPECALNPTDVKQSRKCHGACMTALYPLTNSSVYEVVRSCLDDKEETDQNVCVDGTSDECKACSGPLCNVALLPESRLSCYSCIDDSCAEPEPSYCIKYKPNDQCFMLFNDRSDIVQMGCVSDLEDSFISNNLHRLYMCSSPDNCNGFENIPKTTMCALCDSNEDPDCASLPQNVPTVTQCTSLPHTQCFSKVISDGSTQRGCVGSLDQREMLDCLSGTSTNCATCEGDRCNIEVIHCHIVVFKRSKLFYIDK